MLSLRQMLGGQEDLDPGAVPQRCPIFLLLAVLAAEGFDFPEDDEVDVEGVALSTFLYVTYPQALCILASLLYGASLLAGEIEDKTLVYLFTRALPRWRVLLGKYLATASVLSAMCGASMTIAFAAVRRARRLWCLGSARDHDLVGACFAFTAIFSLLGLLVPRRAIPVGLIYAVVVEFLLSTVPAVVNELTASFYLRSLAWHVADVELPRKVSRDFEREVVPVIAGADAGTAVGALVAIAVVALSLSAVIIHRRQWPLTEGV